MSSNQRIYLSPPHMGENEFELLREAFESNWIAPLGPHVDAFEKEVTAFTGVPHAAALSAGTAGLHLALRLLGMQPGDEVLCSTLTFIASANPVCYEGGQPVFIDCDAATWNLDPNLLEAALKAAASRNKLPRAVIAVDLYGQCADYDAIEAICARYDVPLLEDAAEALGATYKGKAAGSFGKAAVFSFNGNKIITTSGGGMMVSHDENFIKRTKHLATQARDDAPHYQHSEIGFNYRLSNLLAAVGRGQLMALPERIQARQRNREYYEKALGDLPGVSFMPIAAYGEPNYWLTCIEIDPAQFGADREKVRLALTADNIEARPIWKPLHLQPVFAKCRAVGGAVSEGIFERGLCLPSGSSMSEADLQRVSNIIRAQCEA